MLIGCDRDETGETFGWFDGFILDFSLCNHKFAGDWDIHFNGGCGLTVECGICSFNQYLKDGTCHECHESCAGIGCTHEGPCKTDCADGFDFCHLCTDTECAQCGTYATCDDGFCGELATNLGSVCQCIPGTLRDKNT